MSQSMAERLKKQISAKNLTALVLFGAIILVFVLFGISGRLGGGGIGAAAQVNDSLISVANMTTAENNLRQIYGEMFGNDAARLRQEALRGLIDRELMSQAARKSGIIVGDGEIRDVITKDIPVFQDKGAFQRDFYRRYLEMTRQSPKDFENSIRQQQEALRVRHLFDVASNLTGIEAIKTAQLKAYKMNVQFVKLDHSAMAKAFPVSRSEAEKSLGDAEFLKRAKESFEKNRASYNREEEVRAQHILIMVKPGASPEEDQKALTKTEELKKKSATTDFGKLASQNSDDPGSKIKNGDLGFFGRGRMVPEFDKVAFDSKIGEVVGPVKSQYGYHLIKVTEKHAAETPDFEKQKIDVAQKLIAEEKVNSQMKSVEEAVSKGDDGALEAGLKGINAKWEETGMFDLSQDSAPKLNSIFANNALPELSFDQKLLKRVIRDGDERFILKLKEAKADTPAPVDAGTVAMTEASRANSLFSGWMGEFKKVSKVNVNNELLKQ
ncbi:MAG: SurA N-terminal domain-containing protein [Bdellovibrionaceae bacterium]|nr:SurA N-terminal domain-containing protein [Pseudobdellovibrionaceae bacterium]